MTLEDVLVLHQPGYHDDGGGALLPNHAPERHERLGDGTLGGDVGAFASVPVQLVILRFRISRDPK